MVISGRRTGVATAQVGEWGGSGRGTQHGGHDGRRAPETGHARRNHRGFPDAEGRAHRCAVGWRPRWLVPEAQRREEAFRCKEQRRRQEDHREEELEQEDHREEELEQEDHREEELEQEELREEELEQEDRRQEDRHEELQEHGQEEPRQEELQPRLGEEDHRQEEDHREEEFRQEHREEDLEPKHGKEEHRQEEHEQEKHDEEELRDEVEGIIVEAGGVDRYPCVGRRAVAIRPEEGNVDALALGDVIRGGSILVVRRRRGRERDGYPRAPTGNLLPAGAGRSARRPPPHQGP